MTPHITSWCNRVGSPLSIDKKKVLPLSIDKNALFIWSVNTKDDCCQQLTWHKWKKLYDLIKTICLDDVRV